MKSRIVATLALAGSLAVVPLATAQAANDDITAVSTISVGLNPWGIAISPNAGISAFVADGSSGIVTVVNPRTRAVTGQIQVGGTPTGVVFSPDGSLVYVANYDGYVSVVSAVGTQAVLGTVNIGLDTADTGTASYGIAISPDGSTLYVANRGSNTVSIVDTGSRSEVAEVAVGAYPTGVAVSPAIDRVYVTNSGSSTVSVISTTSRAAPEPSR